MWIRCCHSPVVPIMCVWPCNMSPSHKIFLSSVENISIQIEIFLPLFTDRYNLGLQMVSFAHTAINISINTNKKVFYSRENAALDGPFGAINYDQFDIITES